MKKHIFTLAAGALFFSSVSVATVLPDTGLISTADCGTLGTDVVINTSTGVQAAYSCNVADNAVAITTCHQAGSRQSRVYNCTVVSNGPDGNPGTADDIYNNASCPGGDGSAGNGEFTIVADFTGFVASTIGGGVGAQALGGACDENGAAVDALLPF